MRANDAAYGYRLRTGRFSQPHRIYLITSATERRAPLFRDLSLGRALVHTLRCHEGRGDASTLAFVVMPDHFHWLVELGETRTLSEVVRSVKSNSARRINQTLNTPGRKIWQSSFHDHAIRKEEDILDIARYVVGNPLRARLVRKLGDYPLWDSIWI